MAKPKGGKRAGAGRPRAATTIARELNAAALARDRESARQILQALIYADLRPLVEAQLANAKGIKYLVTRRKSTGKFIRVTEAMAKLKSDKKTPGLDGDDDEETIEVWEKDPSVYAFTDLINRILGKPVEAIELQVPEGITIRHELPD